MENQKKWAGWLIAGLVAAVAVVAVVMTTGTAEPPAVTPTPAVTASLTLNQDVDAVSGATLSSQAVVDAVNEAFAFLEER